MVLQHLGAKINEADKNFVLQRSRQQVNNK